MKKVIDIIATEEKISEKAELKTNRRKLGARRAKRANTEITKAKAIAFVLGVFLAAAIGVALWLHFNSKLTITLLIKQQPLEISDEVEVNPAQTAVDFEKRAIPAQLLPQTLEKTQTFKATAVAFEDKKATGSIRVYNNTNPPTAVSFIANTRFLSSSGGKIFRSADKVSIAKPAQKGGRITPSFADVKVIAEEVGEAYNIGPSKFSLPGLVGSKLYYSVWGESDVDMIGGSVKEVAKVSANDLENAKQDLYKILQDLIIAKLKENLSSDFVMDKKGFLEDDFVFSCQEPQDMNFTCRAVLSGRVLAFNNNDLKNLAFDLLSKRKISSSKLKTDTLQISFTPKTVITQSGKMILSLVAGVKTYEKINEESLLSFVLNKSQSQIEEFLKDNFPQIDSFDFNFLPPWKKKAPQEIENISIRLTF